MQRTSHGAAPRWLVVVVSVLAVLVTGLVPAAVTPARAADTVDFRASAESQGNLRTHRVTVPSSVAAGDALLLFVSSAGAVPAPAPAGWTLVENQRSGTDIDTVLFRKAATAGDAGSGVAVTFDATTKATMTLLAYSGASPSTPVTAVSAGETVKRNTHTTPGAYVATAGSYVVSYWADKSSETTGWTLPDGQTQRSTAIGPGAGRITSVASDSGAPVEVGAAAAVTAQASAATARATMWTVVVQPSPTGPQNVAPVASFTASCSVDTCTVDAGASSDTAPGSVASYAWDFGDGTTATGVTATRTYTTAGQKTISLVVTDNQGLASAPATRNVTVTLPQAQSGPPGHNRLVPDKPRVDTPRIEGGEIWDMEVVGAGSDARVFIVGTFTSAANRVSPTNTVNQPYLLSYNLSTGLIDTSFRPTFGGGTPRAIEATPDGTKLFVAGDFNTVGGVARQKVASLNLTTGAPISSFNFTKSTNNKATALAATNSTLYVGGRFTKINGILMTGLAAVNTTTGAVDSGFDNQLNGGIGVNGERSVPQLKLTNDGSKLLVVHTARQIAGQDRYGMGIIDTATKQLLPWRSTLWDDNLGRVGGVTRIYAADIAPDDSYFIVTSGSGGDAPPISDTVIAYPLTTDSLTNSNVKPLWISRHFDSIYSVAITEVAVYVGGHFGFIEAPGSDDPYPGLENVGYGTGQGLSGYGLGDQVVRRDHLAALNPEDGKALEWYAASNSFEGDKAMEAFPGGLLVGGDGYLKGGVNTGRVAYFDLSTVAFPAANPDTTITEPIEGRVVANNTPFTIKGTARVASGTVGRVQVEIKDRATGQFLQDDGTAFTTTFSNTANTLDAVLDPGTGTERTWSIPATIATTRNLQITAQAFTAPTGGSPDTTPATKRIESFGLDDLTPTTSINGPSGTQPDTTFTVTGTANDDKGVNSLSYWFRDEDGRYLQDDGTVGPIYNTFRGSPDVVGATSATWSYEVTLPHEGTWRGSATAVDTAGQADLRSATRDWLVSSSAKAPEVTITAPVAMTPPFSVPALTMEPGGRLTFAGTASDDQNLLNVEVTLRNSSTRENLGSDCSWGVNVTAGNCRVSVANINGPTTNWTWTTPFNLSPGAYSFTVRATDDTGLTTSSANRGSLTINVQIPGDNPPNTSMSFNAPADKSLALAFTGTATDDKGVESVRVQLRDGDTGRYLQPDGSLAAGIASLNATLASPGATSTTWSLAVTLPTGGNWSFTAIAYDTAGQLDPSTSGATASYRVYPGDGAPALHPTLGQPVNGSTFSEGVIVITGRAEDAPDAFASIARVEVAVRDSAGRYMSSTGTFTSTSASYRTAFLNSPGSAGSNYSYTTPIIPAGTYSVIVRPVDVHSQIGEARTATGVVVTQPANAAPVASFTYSCNANVCTFDGRGSTDENAATLTYSWNFGGQGSASGPLPTKTFNAPGTFAVRLTVTDQWKLTNTSATQNVVIVEPSGNTAPVPVFARSCTRLTCSVNSQGTADPNPGDSISYSWNWGDNTTSNGSSPSAHVYATVGTYTITLTTTDGWGKSASTTSTVTLSEPANNSAPDVQFTVTCSAARVCQTNSAGTVDVDGDGLKYSWNWGDGTNASTSANPSHTYATTGTKVIVLSVTDTWGKVGTATREVTI